MVSVRSSAGCKFWIGGQSGTERGVDVALGLVSLVVLMFFFEVFGLEGMLRVCDGPWYDVLDFVS